MVNYSEKEIQSIAERYQASQDPMEIWWMFDKARSLDPKVIMEIGIYNGGALKVWSLLASRSDDIIIGMDNDFKNWKKFGNWDLKEGIAPVKLIEEDSHSKQALDRVKEILTDRKIDFLFIDGDHTYDGTKIDHETYGELVRPGGMIAFHDLNMKKRLSIDGIKCGEYWDNLSNPKYSFFSPRHDDTCYGIGYIMKE